MPFGQLTWKDNEDPGGAGVGNNCAVDSSRKIVFLAYEADGLFTYKYSSAGIMTFADSHFLSGLALGVALDTTLRLAFLADNSKTGIQPPGTLLSYSYDDAGILTYIMQIAPPLSDAKGIGVDTDRKLLFVAMYTNGGVQSFSYTNLGVMAALDWVAPPGWPSPIGISVDPSNMLVFITTLAGGVFTYKYTALGIITAVDNHNLGAVANGACLDITNKLLFLSNGVRGMDVYSYTAAGNLSWIAQYDPGAGAGMFGINIDTDQKFVFLPHGTTGIFVYEYDNAGACSLNDSDNQGGIASGVALDKSDHLAFLANWDRGIESYFYSYYPIYTVNQVPSRRKKMSSIIKFPAANDVVQHTAFPIAAQNFSSLLNFPYDPSDYSYINTTAGPAVNQDTFTKAAILLLNTHVSNIEIFACIRLIDSLLAGSHRLCYKVAAGTVYSPVYTLSSAYTWYSHKWEFNPATGKPWTLPEINLILAYGIESTVPAAQVIRCNNLYLNIQTSILGEYASDYSPYYKDIIQVGQDFTVTGKEPYGRSLLKCTVPKILYKTPAGLNGSVDAEVIDDNKLIGKIPAASNTQAGKWLFHISATLPNGQSIEGIPFFNNVISRWV